MIEPLATHQQADPLATFMTEQRARLPLVSGDEWATLQTVDALREKFAAFQSLEPAAGGDTAPARGSASSVPGGGIWRAERVRADRDHGDQQHPPQQPLKGALVEPQDVLVAVNTQDLLDFARGLSGIYGNDDASGPQHRIIGNDEFQVVFEDKQHCLAARYRQLGLQERGHRSCQLIELFIGKYTIFDVDRGLGGIPFG